LIAKHINIKEKEKKAMDYARSFTVERMALETYKVYEKVASK
jgi:hypothetical protein